jgi:hypothetical protein
MNIKKNTILLYFSVSFIYVGYLIGYNNLNPASIDWLFNESDLISYYLPWHFYSSSDWSIKIFNNYNYGLEISENLFFSDNVQLLNLILRPFKLLTKLDFQYISLWYLICVTLQGYFSFKIIHHYTKNEIYSFIASILFIILPFFLDRLFIHISLAAHWLILWAIYLQMKYMPEKSLKKWSFLISLSFFININISIMVVLYFYLHLTFLFIIKQIKLKQLIFLYTYFLILIIISLFFCGFFTISFFNMPDFGYGIYKSNLLSLLDSGGGILTANWSNLFFDFNNIPGEQEGFSFLGLTFYILLFYSFFYMKYNFFSNKNNLFYIFIGLFFLVISLTNKIHFGDQLLVDISLNKYLFGLLSIVRSSGRFIWITAYLLLIFVLIFSYKIFDKKIILSLFLIFLLSIQLFDQRNAFTNIKLSFQKPPNINSHNPFWEKVSNNYPFFRTSFVLSDPEGIKLNGEIISHNNFKGTNITYISRIDRANFTKARYDTYIKIFKKNLDEDSIYWIHPDHLNHILYLYDTDKNYHIFEKNNLHYIIKKKNNLTSLFVQNKKNKKINFPEIILSKKLKAKFNKSFFGIGWLSGGSFWSDGPYSSILFKNNFDVKKLILITEVFNYNKETIDNFKFYLNDKLLENVTFNFKSNVHIIEIPLNRVTLQNNNHLLIRNNNKLTRSDISIYPDPRLIGLNIKEFYFE